MSTVATRAAIDWRVKASLFRLFDAAPGGELAHYLTQRYVIHTMPRRLNPTAHTARWSVEHWRAFQRCYAGDLGSAHLLELGAGWDLYANLVLWCYGLNRQTVVDIRRHARGDHVSRVIRHLRQDPPPGATRTPTAELAANFARGLEEHYGISYLAPCDAAALPIASGSVDLVSSTQTLEHIPPATLASILCETRRVVHDHSVVSHVLDYSDHYAHSDHGITDYNFLRFSAAQWRRYSPAIHYQNRLRHADYAALLCQAGFAVTEERRWQPDDADRLLATVPVAEEFCRYPRDELTVLQGHFICAVVI